MSLLILLLIVIPLVLIGAVAVFVTVRSRPGDLAPPRPDTRVDTAGPPIVVEPPVVEEPIPAATPETVVEEPRAEPVVEEPVAASFRDRMARARSAFGGALGSIVGRSAIDQATWDDLEEALIRADVGVGLTDSILTSVRSAVKSQGIATPDALLIAVKAELRSRLVERSPLGFADGPPSVWLFVGVNGVGKTTTIGKVGQRLADNGKRVVMAAGDTFRAAAAEQLGTWATRSGAELVRGAEGGDPSAVIFDGIAHAAADGFDVVLADTAGRLHTKSNLMDELSKVRRVADKAPGEVTEVLLVLDATTGQNGLTQARQFTAAVELTGVVLTKLDGSAKGGIVFAIEDELGIPVKLVGLGETAADLVDFDPDEFVDALF